MWLSPEFQKAFIGASCSAIATYVAAKYFAGNGTVYRAISGFMFSMIGAKLQSLVKVDLFVASLYIPFLPNRKFVL